MADNPAGTPPITDYEIGCYPSGADLVIYVNQLPCGVCVFRRRVRLFDELRGEAGRQVSVDTLRRVAVSARISDCPSDAGDI